MIKKTGVAEPFDCEKIRRGLQRACWKRPISEEQIDRTVSDVELAITRQVGDEIDSRTLGEIVMEHLSQLDEVAFVRFASVYREFKDVRDFVDELKPILQKQTRTGPKEQEPDGRGA